MLLDRGHEIREFFRAVKSGKNITIPDYAMRRARESFGVRTQAQGLSVIKNAEDALFFNDSTKLSGNQQISIDSYKWERPMGRPGYLAFYKSTTGKWVVKSLHEDDDAPLTNRT